MRKLFFVLCIVYLLPSCNNENMETGIPEIKIFRVLGYDGSGGYVEKDSFILGSEHPNLEFTVYDDDLDIDKISIILNNTIVSSNIIRYTKDFIFALNQETNPQTYIFQIEVNHSFMGGFDNYWSLQFFLTDKSGNKSKTYTSSNFGILPPL